MMVSMVSTKRLPASLCVPKDSFRQMTAWRRARSASLFVGPTPSTSTNVHKWWRPLHNSSHMPAKRRLPLKAPLVFQPAYRQQQGFHAVADGLHQSFEPTTRERPVANAFPEPKPGVHLPFQIMSQPFGLRVAAVDQGLKVAD